MARREDGKGSARPGAAAELLTLALKAGGHDNITIVLVPANGPSNPSCTASKLIAWRLIW
jgi:serine/threonine protein phosphatase PrpC